MTILNIVFDNDKFTKTKGIYFIYPIGLLRKVDPQNLENLKCSTNIGGEVNKYHIQWLA
jgi:hypothetical protein